MPDAPNPPAAPDVRLFIATGCAHCPIVLSAAADLVKQGRIGRLEVVNIVARPESARAEGVRSAPTVFVGPFRLEGALRPAELAEWVERAGREDGATAYLAELIESRRLDEALREIRARPEWQPLLVEMIGDIETPIGVRIGAGALLEELAERGALDPLLPDLRALLDSPRPQVRADAAYYLGLSDRPEVRAWLAPLREDPDPSVREIVAEALGDDG